MVQGFGRGVIFDDELRVRVCRLTASERRGDNLEGFNVCFLKARTSVWPRLSYVCRIRKAAITFQGPRHATSVNLVVASISE